MAMKFSIKIIFANDYLIFDENSGFKEMSLTSQTVDDNVMPKYGVISRIGSVSFLDSTNSFVSKLKAKNYPVEVEIYQNGQLFGSFVATKQCSFNVFTKLVKMDIKGNIINWQSINVEKKDITYNQSAYQILLYLISLQTVVPSISDIEITNDTVAFLQSINVPIFYLEAGTLWEQFDKLCNLAQLRIYENRFNKVTIERYV